MRIRRWLAIFMVLGLVAAACGSDDDADTTQATSTDTTAASTDTTAASTDTTEPAATAGEGFRVAWIYDGAQNDGGWNSAHDAGKQFVEAALPGLETSFLEEIANGPDAIAAFEELATQGFDLIIGTTFYQFDVFEVAPNFPDTSFLTWGGVDTLENVGQFDVRSEDGRYLDGLIAGAMVGDNGKIGYPAGFPIEEVARSMNAFLIGAREINPDVTIEAVWINSWWDPPTETQAVEALLNDGATLIAHELNSPAAAAVVEERGIPIIGYGIDASATAPNSWLGTFTFNWGPYYLQQVENLINGTWQAEASYGGLPEGLIGFSETVSSEIPQDILDLVEQRRQELIDGTFDFFEGPLVDNKGVERVPAGGTIPQADRPACCDWLLEGISGEIPTS